MLTMQRKRTVGTSLPNRVELVRARLSHLLERLRSEHRLSADPPQGRARVSLEEVCAISQAAGLLEGIMLADRNLASRLLIEVDEVAALVDHLSEITSQFALVKEDDAASVRAPRTDVQLSSSEFEVPHGAGPVRRSSVGDRRRVMMIVETERRLANRRQHADRRLGAGC